MKGETTMEESLKMLVEYVLERCTGLEGENRRLNKTATTETNISGIRAGLIWTAPARKSQRDTATMNSIERRTQENDRSEKEGLRVFTPS